MIRNRIGRIEFLFWCGVTVATGTILLTLAGAPDVLGEGSPLHWLYSLVMLCASGAILRAEVSRLRDIGLAGWTVLLTFVPIVRVVMFLVLLLAPGQRIRNSRNYP